MKGHTALVQQLVDRGADVDVVTATSRSPLHAAALTNRLDIAKILLSQSAACVNHKDSAEGVSLSYFRRF